MLERVAQIPRRALKAALYLVLLTVGLAFGLTHTQVGRDSVRAQLESFFAERFEGRLTIGQLHGNLINTFFASDVRLLAPDGQTVLTVDSLVIRPTWSSVFERSISVRDLRLIRPSLTLARDSSEIWNLQAALQRRGASGRSAPWTFTSTNVRIVDGLLETLNAGSRPRPVANQHVFDYTNTRLEQIHASATVDLQPENNLIDFTAFSAQPVVSDQELQARGQLILRGSSLKLSAFNVALGDTRLALTGSIDGLKPFSTMDLSELAAVHVDLELRPSTVRVADVLPFLPALPLRDQIHFRAGLSGPFSDLTIRHAVVSRGSSSLSGSGALRGLPDSLAFRAEFDSSEVFLRDLEAVLPAYNFEAYRHLGSLTIQAQVDGVLQVDTPVLALDSDFRLSGVGGSIRGSARLNRNPAAGTMISGHIHTRAFDLGHLLKRPALRSNLNGTLIVDAANPFTSHRTARIDLNLAPSGVAGRTLDSLRLRVGVEALRLDGQVLAYQGESRLAAAGVVDLAQPEAPYHLEATTRNLNLTSLFLNEALQTRLNTNLAFRGTGHTLNDVRGTLDLDVHGSRLGTGTDQLTVVGSSTSIVLERPEPTVSRMRVTGDVLEASLDGSFDLGTLRAAAGLWATTLGNAIDRQRDKPHARAATARTTDGPGPAQSGSTALQRQAELRSLMDARGYAGALNAELSLTLKRTDVFRVFWEAIPAFAGGETTARLDAEVGPDHLSLVASSTSDTLHSGSLQIEGLTATASLSGPFAPTLESTLRLHAEAETSRLAYGAQSVQNFTLRADYEALRGRILLNSDQVGRNGALQLDADLHLLTDRNRLAVHQLTLRTRDFVWANTTRASIDLYKDAYVFKDLILENTAQDTTRASGPAQRITATGTLSAARTDTMTVTLERIELDDLDDFIQFREPLGGALNARLAVNRTEDIPEIVGFLTIDDLSISDRNIGRLAVRSQFAGIRANGILLDVSLKQPNPVGPGVEANDLDITGRIRLPVVDPTTGVRDPGALALDVDMNRADFFFFDLIFKELLVDTEGYAQGKGRITGTFDKPLFEGSFEGKNAVVNIPRFNLRYSLAGPFAVDERGFHLQEIDVTDPSGGRGTVRGSLLFNDYRYFSYDLDGELEDLQVMNITTFSSDLPFYGSIWASGTLTLDGPTYNAVLRSTDAVTRTDSELFIPITEVIDEGDAGFIVFADSTGAFPDLDSYTRRRNLVSRRPEGERGFLDGLEMNLNILAPEGSTVHLVFDPLLGDVINAVGSGRIQLLRREGEFYTYGTFNVNSGDYLFTATEVFVRRFELEPGGTIVWDGDPIDGVLTIPATYRTRASLAGLPGRPVDDRESLPFLIHMDITGRVTTPLVDLRINLDQDNRIAQGREEGIEALLNRSDLAAEYATSVLLTNTFLLTSSQTADLSTAAGDLLFNSLSQLVASQLNRFISEVVTNLDVNVGLQQGRTIEEIDLTYGFALRLLDARLVIRGEGVYRSDQQQRNTEAFNGGLAVEVRLNPHVILEVFYRRENDPYEYTTSFGSAYGAGLIYQTEFPNWNTFVKRIRGDGLPLTAPPDSLIASPPDSSRVVSRAGSN